MNELEEAIHVRLINALTSMFAWAAMLVGAGVTAIITMIYYTAIWNRDSTFYGLPPVVGMVFSGLVMVGTLIMFTRAASAWRTEQRNLLAMHVAKSKSGLS